MAIPPSGAGTIAITRSRPYAAPPGDSIVGNNILGQPAFHYLDDAVTGSVQYLPAAPPPQNLIETNMSPLDYSTNPSIDGFGNGVIAPSEDLAFSLYYNNVPEPVALPILGMSMSCSAAIGEPPQPRRKPSVRVWASSSFAAIANTAAKLYFPHPNYFGGVKNARNQQNIFQVLFPAGRSRIGLILLVSSFARGNLVTNGDFVSYTGSPPRTLPVMSAD